MTTGDYGLVPAILDSLICEVTTWRPRRLQNHRRTGVFIGRMVATPWCSAAIGLPSPAASLNSPTILWSITSAETRWHSTLAILADGTEIGRAHV